jgi:alanine-glyoxylate transaminase/serine-glyoxylate transaminase/serine-pyruvate transaminase
VPVDALGIDVCYSGGQKCLSAPPGLSPITFSTQAVESIKGRRQKVQSWYLDVSLLEQYWTETGARVYHHTAPVLMVYALREACRLVAEEGLEARVARHARCALALRTGLQAMGLQVFAQEPYRLDTVTGVLVPEGVNDAAVRGRLLEEFGIEIAGGLGAYRGRMWRVGMMGYSCSEANVLLFLAALGKILNEEGYRNGGGVEAATVALR